MNRYKSAAVLSALVLVCYGALLLGQKVNAAGEGKITGTVKLDGAAPHMKGIDMSKDPYCVKAHANDPGHLETYVVGANGGLENVVLYISDWSGSAQVSTTVPDIRSERTVCTRRTCWRWMWARHSKWRPAIRRPTTFTPIPTR